MLSDARANIPCRVPAENDAAALHLRDHLRDHLTDGAWHDRCYFCLNRRVHGGTGVSVTNGGHK